LRNTSTRKADDGAYVPELPGDDWQRIEGFVRGVVAAVEPDLPYPTAAVLNAVAHHVDWCVSIAGLPLNRDALFRRDIIGAAVAVMPTSKTSTQGRRRSLLFRVGEALGAIPVAPPLPPLAAASPSAPYTSPEIDDLWCWALGQREAHDLSARALVSLGLGAGLPTRDICSVRAVDVLDGGEAVRVAGPIPRIIPVSDEWGTELALLACSVKDTGAPLFRPNVAWSKNIVTLFVTRSLNSGLQPSTQRMRATWLVHHLAAGTPMQDLLSAAGLASMDALVRYQQFLPPPSTAAREDTTR
jgi:hypothetical protein